MKFKKQITIMLFCLTFSNFLFAQEKNPENIDGDVCYVYVVDVAKAKLYGKLKYESKNEAQLKKLEKEVEIHFPKFTTKIGEEEMTTKTYEFPKSKMIITASVFYTDESLESSMIIGISVTNKKEISAIGYPPFNGSITEILYDDNTSIVRTKQYVKVLGKSYLVGLECDCSAKREKKENK